MKSAPMHLYMIAQSRGYKGSFKTFNAENLKRLKLVASPPRKHSRKATAEYYKYVGSLR